MRIVTFDNPPVKERKTQLNAENCFDKGIKLLDENKIEEAIVLLQRCNELMPQNCETYYNLGIAFFRTGNYKKAIKYFKNAYNLEPDNPDVLSCLGLTYAKIGQLDVGQKVLFLAHQKAPKNTDILNNLASVCSFQEKHNEAIDYLKKAISVDPENNAILKNLGLAYGKNELHIEAIDAFEQVRVLLKKAPRNKGFLYHVDPACYKNYHDEGVLQTIVDYADVMFNLSVAHGKLDNHLEVQKYQTEEYKYWKIANEINPNNTTILSNLGDTCFRMKNYHDAIQWYQKSLKVDQNNLVAQEGLTEATDLLQ